MTGLHFSDLSGILTKQYVLKGVKLVFSSSSFLIQIWWYPEKQSRSDINWLFAASSTILSIRGRGKSSFGQALFRSVKFIHILHLPLFFFTGTVLASQVGYLTSRMTFASSRRWTSALTAAAFSSDILRGLCFLGLAPCLYRGDAQLYPC